ncbi:MAG TPA: MotA/TolQ/ExbB proton channel family protein, partial [Gemmataceae bacterium]|nr:MotA/TolQ/ExbB proton channel family protein [Gemmataceae bacterium]
RRDYLERVRVSGIDWIIITAGFTLFAAQTVCAWRALRWRDTDFDLRADRWLSHLAQGAEWFPLLGLIGTVAAILQTFSSISADPSPQNIIKNYAPAITATGSGLFMALINILPTWVVTVGRDLIRSLAGVAPSPSADEGEPVPTPPLSPAPPGIGDQPASPAPEPARPAAPSGNVAASPARPGHPGQSSRGGKA